MKKELELEKRFDKLFFSCEMNSRKPEKKIYEKAISSLKEKPQKILFIDDRIRNLEPAKELGIKTIQYKNLNDIKTQLLNF